MLPAQATNNLPATLEPRIPVPIQLAEPRAFERYLDFFLTTIRNPNTRAACWRAVQRFFAWCEDRGLVQLHHVRPLHVSAYVEQLELAPASVKQHLAAIRRCLDWLVSGGVLDVKPASSVKGPQHIVRQGKTPLLDAEQTRCLLDSISLHNIVGLRDRAIIGAMVFSFGRVGAVCAMDVRDYYVSGRHRMFRLHEKGARSTRSRRTTTPWTTWRTTWTMPTCGTSPRRPCSRRSTPASSSPVLGCTAPTYSR